MNKTAKEMFEELGYYRCYNSATTLEYCFGEKENYCVIRFWKHSKHIELFGGKCLGLDNYEFYENDYKLFVAINKQIEELGWNNE